MGNPLERGIGVVSGFFPALERCKGAVGCAQIPVAYQLQIVDRVLIKTGFPKPLGFEERLSVYLRFALYRGRKVAVLQR
ncbi:MAG: hypothetical protein WCL08_12360 [Verrucomicrobiota bacterium]